MECVETKQIKLDFSSFPPDSQHKMAPVSKKRKDISLNDKHEVLSDLAAKVSCKDICVKFGITKSTVSRISKQKEQLEEDFQSLNGVSAYNV